jgi:hypothetical protein
MQQTTLKDQMSIKILSNDDVTSLTRKGVITSNRIGLPPNCYIIPMVVLDKPIPARSAKRARRSK